MCSVIYSGVLSFHVNKYSSDTVCVKETKLETHPLVTYLILMAFDYVS